MKKHFWCLNTTKVHYMREFPWTAFNREANGFLNLNQVEGA